MGSDSPRPINLAEPGLAERFWKSVRKSDGCWEWTGTKDRKGYGAFSAFYRRNAAHRLAFMLAAGRVLAAEECVCHRCDNRGCVRPDHLFVGTAADNNADMKAKGRLVPPRGQRPIYLTPEIVAEIRASSESLVKVARRLGVSPSTANRVRLGRRGSDPPRDSRPHNP